MFLELGAVAAATGYAGHKIYQGVLGYRRSPKFLARKHDSLLNAAQRATDHHQTVLTAISSLMYRHQASLQHGQAMVNKLVRE